MKKITTLSHIVLQMKKVNKIPLEVFIQLIVYKKFRV